MVAAMNYELKGEDEHAENIPDDLFYSQQMDQEFDCVGAIMA